MRNHPISGYGYFLAPPLSPWEHPAAWVETRGEEMVDFKGKGIPGSEFQKGYCTSLKYDIISGSESIRGQRPIATLLHDMIGDNPAGVFPSQVNFRQFTTVNRNTRFTY